MADFSINRLNLPGLQNTASTNAKQNTQKNESLLSQGGTDQLSLTNRLGGSGVASDIKSQVAQVGNLSLEEARKQLSPSTRFGLGLLS